MLDILEGLLPHVRVNLPCGEDMALGEDLLDLLKGTALRLREAEEYVNEGSEVEGTENEVRLVRDI